MLEVLLVNLEFRVGPHLIVYLCYNSQCFQANNRFIVEIKKELEILKFKFKNRCKIIKGSCPDSNSDMRQDNQRTIINNDMMMWLIKNFASSGWCSVE